MPLDLSKLNPHQREAVTHGSGPLLILAGAGSGKTNTMAHRIAHLISERGLKGNEILGLSFTNKAARELKERVIKMVSPLVKDSQLKGLTISTFHSFCVKLIRAHSMRLGFQPGFSILDSGDQNDVLKQVLKNIKIDDRKFDTGFLLSQFSLLKNSSVKTEAAQEHFLESIQTGRLHVDYATAAAAAFPKYQERLKTLNALDFDDLIYMAEKLLSENEDIRSKLKNTLKHILVDEYQDTNASQFRLIQLLTDENPNLCVVGDDDQSIYAWRGADPAHILQFKNQYPRVKVITLEQNYRSTQIILDSANSVIADNKVRHAKKLWSNKSTGPKIKLIICEDDRDEAETVADDIRAQVFESHHGVLRQIRPFSDYAVLYRSNAQSRAFEEAMRMSKIPYKMVGGMSFLDRKEIKDVLSYYRFIINPNDDASLRRVLLWPTRGIGKKTIDTLHEFSVKNGISLYSAITNQVESNESLLQTRALEPLKKLVAFHTERRQALEALILDPGRISLWAIELIKSAGLESTIIDEEETTANADKKIENIKELANSLSIYTLSDFDLTGEATSIDFLTEFLSRLALQAKDDLKKEDDSTSDQVTLMTLHSSKGLEFQNVYLVGAEDGYLPHKKIMEENGDLSEERRLCYVGMTRAKSRLVITRCNHRIRWGKKVPRILSRFLDKVLVQFEVSNETGGVDLNSVEAVEKHEVRVKSFLDQLKSRLGEDAKK
ncbi:MAG: UvrD-helicase domain-containing protein [Xanthomonadaceae bacterium]|nr:UvrD-helicase domain-containing protein [Xanthomonadaceae bacterium]